MITCVYTCMSILHGSFYDYNVYTGYLQMYMLLALTVTFGAHLIVVFLSSTYMCIIVHLYLLNFYIFVSQNKTVWYSQGNTTPLQYKMIVTPKCYHGSCQNLA